MIQLEIHVLTKDDAEIYLALRVEGLKQNPEAFSSSYEDIINKEILLNIKRKN